MKSVLTPNFYDSKKIQISVATTDYCNACCSYCIWPYMKSHSRVMTNKDFKKLIELFNGYQFTEFTLNIINEPFADRGLIQKLFVLAEHDISIRNFFFSSNWLIPNSHKIDEFVGAIQYLTAHLDIEWFSLNATISGIDDKSYDILQAGSMLSMPAKKHRPLIFENAVNNICEVIKKLSVLNLIEKIFFRIKAYGDLFNQDTMRKFWITRLRNCGISNDFIDNNVKIVLNENYTSFARFRTSKDQSTISRNSRCNSGWLTEKIAIGPGGEVGLCCNDGIRSVWVGNIFDQPLDDLIFSETFQYHLRIVNGLEKPENNHPCRRCEFYLQAISK